MDLLVGLGVFGLLVVLTIILPIASFLRARRALQIADDLRGRLEALERKVHSPSVAADVRPTAAEAAVSPDPSPPAGERISQASVVPPATPASVHTSLATPRQSPAQDRPDLEQVIGGSWLLYAGVAAVVLGMSYFVKFAFESGWISERLRVMAGGVTGVVLLAAGMRFWSRGLALFGQALAGGGVVVLYLSIYAALHFYQLITPAPAFGLMVIVTAGAAYFADRQGSQPLAALALLGGFATPLLIGGKEDAQAILFTYIAILVSGSALLARRHKWPLLSAASYVCTCLLVITWFFSSYHAAEWLRTELFLTLYAGLFGYLLWALLRSKEGSPQAQLAVAALATAPLAYHLASLILLNAHPGAWLVYLVLFTVAGLIVAQTTGAAWVRVAVLLLVGLPFLVWLQLLRYPRWYTPAVVTVFVLYALHLAAQWERAGGDGPSGDVPPIDVVHTQLNGLLLPLSLYVFLETRFAWWNPWMVAALSAWNAGLAGITRSRAPRMTLQFIALSATLAAVALVLAFDGPVVALGWAAEGVLIGWLALRARNWPLAIGSGALIALGSTQLALLLAAPLPAGDTPILNSRALAAAVVIGLLAWLASRMREDRAAQVHGEARNAVIILANVLGIALLSADIHAYFSQRAVDASIGGEPMGIAAAQLAEQLTLSVTWALYAVALVAVGVRRRYAPARYLAIVLFALTVSKVLLRDIAGLDPLYRMLSVLGVGVLLLVASYLYQRMAAEART